MDAQRSHILALSLSVVFSLSACTSDDGGAGTNAQGRNEGTHNVSMTPVVGGLEHPWALAFLPGGDILVTERPGRLRLVRNGQISSVSGLPSTISATDQGGLLDIELHPDFETNRLVYFSYSADIAGGPTLRVDRAIYQNGRLNNPEPIFEAAPPVPGYQHFGSRRAFAKQSDGEVLLYISLGERHNRDLAQDPSSHAGSIVRIRDDGDPRVGNPSFDAPNARNEIFSIGHRNPQGLTRNPTTGEIWSHEHGPQGGDEVNIIRGGRNYGWPVITHGTEYGPDRERIGPTAKEGMEQPLYHWSPDSIAPSGMTFYQGDRFPNWRGDLFLGALAARALVRLEVEGGQDITGEERFLEQENMRIRDVAVGPDGYLWIITDHAPDGQLIRLEPAK